MIVLGRILVPFGIRGWVKVQAYGDDPESWCAMPHWWLSRDADAPAANWRRMDLEEASRHGKGLVAKFAGIDDRDAALALTGCLLAAPREALPKNVADEYYWGDLVGLDVVNAAGERLGQVKTLIESGANAVLCVADGETERLLPFVATVVQQVDLEARLIRVVWGLDW